MAIFKSKIRVRFAPSPTGWLHVGGLRTAFYSYLYAKQRKGKFILRIEDTDRERYVKGAQDKLMQTLDRFNLKYDEGPNKGGKYGPYIQSQRLGLYRQYAEKLLAQNQAYRCFCTSARLTEMREQQIKDKQPPKYDRTCLRLSTEEIHKKMNNTDASVIRLKIPEGETVFDDMVRGKIKIQNETLDDQIIIKSDGYPTYHLAVVVDDYLMKISHVIRGEEWIPSTPKHIIIYQALNWPLPQYAHLPLLLNPDKSKLSKRQGDVAVEEYLNKGYLPEALLNFIALLGWNPGTDQEIFTVKELIKAFAINKVQKGGAVFNKQKLDWINSQYIKAIPDYKLADLAFKSLSKFDYFEKNKFQLVKLVALFKERLNNLAELGKLAKFLYELPDYDAAILIAKKSNTNKTQLALTKGIALIDTYNHTWHADALKKYFDKMREQIGLTRSEMFWPLRVAVSGLERSPDVFDIMEVLGEAETKNRIRLAIEKLHKI